MQHNLKSAFTKGVCFLLLATIFALIYTQAPLYSSNQNLYFLYGLAKAGYGHLSADWLANTTDPVPFFSLLVRVFSSLPNGEIAFYLIYALLQGIYLVSLLGIVYQLFHIEPTSTDWQALLGKKESAHPDQAVRALIVLVMILLLHSAALRFALSKSLGEDWVFLFEGGVAFQRILGLVLQPSVFAVFLVSSIYFGIQRRYMFAILCAALAATFHPTYLLAAGLIIMVWNIQQWQENQVDCTSTCSFSHWKSRLTTIIVSVVCLAPTVMLTASHFLGTPASEAQAAQSILVNFRFPHHAIPSEWWNSSVIVQLMLCAAALWIIRRDRLFSIMAVLYFAAISLTLIQIITHSTTLALLFPWRLSILLVPLSSSLMSTAVFDYFWKKIKITIQLLRLIAVTCFILIAILLGVGIMRITLDFDRKLAADDLPVALYAKQTLPSNSLILIPPKLEDFRINSGFPIYVDFKSHPYRSDEVLEWYRRIKLANRFYNKYSCQVFQQIIKEGITHLVLPKAHHFNCTEPTKEIYSDASYVLFAIAK